jgi:Carboxypeptidase regulatory-like domain
MAATQCRCPANRRIAGLVTDASGSVLPGVTVEASSPALIEKVRVVITDGTGQYRIVDLRPGVYTVTFQLPSFSTVRRDGIELSIGFTATVNAELRVGTVEETITVADTSPIVDIQNVNQIKVVTRELIDTIPNSNNVLRMNGAYGSEGAAWARPQAIVPGRLLKLGAQLSF